VPRGGVAGEEAGVLDLDAGVFDVGNAGGLGDGASARAADAELEQRERAPTATAASATSGVYSARRKTSTMSIGLGTWSRLATTGTPKTSVWSHSGLTP
jgi:hypothetical protein